MSDPLSVALALESFKASLVLAEFGPFTLCDPFIQLVAYGRCLQDVQLVSHFLYGFGLPPIMFLAISVHNPVVRTNRSLYPAPSLTRYPRLQLQTWAELSELKVGVPKYLCLFRA